MENLEKFFHFDDIFCQPNLIFPYNSSSNPDNIGVPFNQTTCGNDAYLRGSHQKIVGFSFYGDVNSDYSKKKGYFEGIIGNLELMPKFYPGWVMRLYYDLDQTDPVLQDLCQLACTHSNIDICNAKHLPGNPFVDASRVFPMNWRFFPTLDPQVSSIPNFQSLLSLTPVVMALFFKYFVMVGHDATRLCTAHCRAVPGRAITHSKQ